MKFKYGKRSEMSPFETIFARTYDRLRKRGFRGQQKGFVNGRMQAAAYQKGAVDALDLLASELESSNLVDDLL